MDNNATNKKILYIGLLVLFTVFVIGIVWANSKPVVEEYNFPSPENVVRQYFTAWNNRDYANIYATFSDGFKRIEPTAANLQNFKDYLDSQNIETVNIIKIKEAGNDGQASSVDYSVEFLMDNGEKLPYKGTFTLKYRTGDIIQGWKLIHPYGENIDSS